MEEMSRQGLMLWLKALVESGKCPGVSWVNQEAGIFKIPWGNQKSRSWQKEDSKVFLEYAKHTRKYQPNDDMDFPKWKQNLKSAINKNRFIERLKGMDRLCGPKPFRVYRFLSEITARKKSSDKVSASVENLGLSGQINNKENSLETAPVMAVNEQSVTLSLKSASASSSLFSATESESHFSPTQSNILDCNSPLSSFISRSDLSDQSYGNIPVFVEELSNGNMFFTGEISRNADVLENEAEASLQVNYIADDNVFLKSIQTPVQGTHISNKATREVAENGSYVQISFQSISVQTQLDGSHSTTIQRTITETDSCIAEFSNALPGSKHNGLPSQAADISKLEQPMNHKLTLMQDQIRHQQPRADYLQDTTGPTSAQKNNLTFKATADSTTDLKHYLPGTKSSDKALKPAQPRTKYTTSISDTSNEESGYGTESFSELYDTNSSILPCSMDTSESSITRLKPRFSGSQFSTYREIKMPTDVPNYCLNTKPDALTRNDILTPRPSCNPKPTPTDDSVMHMQVLYGTPHRIVKEVKLTSSTNSCRLFFGSVNCSVMQKAMQGQQEAEEVELPSVNDLDYTQRTKDTIFKILKEMELGIVIYYRDGDIYVERRCLPRVYLSDGVSTSESLPRSTVKRPDVVTKVFDFKLFTESIERNKANLGPFPKDHRFLTVGYEILANDDSPTRLVPVYIVVRHVLAARIRFKILGASTIAPNPMCSDPNSFDKTVAFFKEIDLKK